MKRALGLLMIMSAMETSLRGGGMNDGSMGHGIPENPKKVIPNGCKEYTINGITVIASSEKAAIKKIDKRLKHSRHDGL